MNQNSKTNNQLVKDFMTIFRQKYRSIPTDKIDLDTVKLRLKLDLEETGELVMSIVSAKKQKLFDLLFQFIQEQIAQLDEDDIDINLVGVADALADKEYINHGTALSFGIPLDAVFSEVHSSNLSKLDEMGMPIFREDGKALKGPKYQPPNISKVLMEYGADVSEL